MTVKLSPQDIDRMDNEQLDREQRDRLTGSGGLVVNLTEKDEQPRRGSKLERRRAQIEAFEQS